MTRILGKENELKPTTTIIQLWVTKWSLPHKFLVLKIETRKTTLKAVISCLLDFLYLSFSVERMNR